jgi:hypothetical protein
MEVIDSQDKNNWFIIGNKLSTSYMNFYISYKPVCEKNEILYMLRVINNNMSIDLKFNTLEDAIHFAKTYIKSYYENNLEEINSIYKKEYKNKVLKRMFKTFFF